MNKPRQKCILKISCCLVLLVYTQSLDAIQTSTVSSLLPSNGHEYNITEYLSDASLEPELRLAVGEALLLEGDADVNRCSPGRPPSPPPACPPMKHRLPSGACDNVRHPRWGSVGQPFLRLVPPAYADGKSHPRRSSTESELPEAESTAQLIESLMKEGEELPLEDSPIHPHLTALTGAWAQLVIEDLARTVHPARSQCCNGTIIPECFPGKRQELNQCQEYVRAAPTRKEPCQPFHYRQTMNLATSFLDGSGIYGTNENALNSLRVGYGGRIVNPSNQPPLHRLFLAEHNRLAFELIRANPHWDDEDIFLEARRIVIAEIQHITYSEWLPVVIGDMKDLRLQTQGYFHGYSSGHEAGVYASAVLTALTSLAGMLDDENQQGEFTSKLASWSDTLARKPSINSGPHFEGWTPGARFIHMGRDIGLASYEDFANFCNISIKESLPDAARNALFKHYGNNNKMSDIDLIAGGILETPAPGAALGPTLACILTLQFIKTRNSDRFWYENDIPPGSFDKDQLQEIRRVRVAGLLCANSEGLSSLQPHAFVREDSYLNARLPCSLHPLPDVASAWRAPEPIPQLPDEMLMQAVRNAEEEMRRRREREYQLWTVNGGVDPKSPIGTAAAFSKANKQALAIANHSLVYEFASLELLNQLSRERRGSRRRRRQLVSFVEADTEAAAALASPDAVDALANGLHDIDVSAYLPEGLPDGAECDDNDNIGSCDSITIFRTITGWCNNLRNPGLGRSLSPFARLLPPSYENGVARPRMHSTTGVPLPSARLVSTTIHADISNLHNRYTLMVMQFAQFLDHDLTFTPQHRGFFASIPDCRSCESARTVHPECMPIELPPGDHYYPAVNQSSGERFCLPFMRSIPGQLHLGAREQLNQNSAFLDGSVIYGEHLCLARHLRGYAGRMNATLSPHKAGKELLPQTNKHPECKSPSGLCFVGGDGRASEQPALTVIHTLYLREHNRIADGLRELNPHWDSDKVFQHTRRIVVAGLQHITYNEFLPRILGWAAVSLYELKLRPQGYYKGYNPSCNPSIVNEFATAAFRIGHSLLRPHIPRMSPQYQAVDPPLLLRNNFFNPDILYQPHMIDEITRGLVSTPMENLDQFITGEITNHLFEDRRIPHSGVDLIALNIQRARDHGLRSYNDYRALCNLKRAATFEDLSREVPSEVIARLRRIYASVEDIDIFPGGMSERPLQGGLVGPTFACIIGLQFRQLRKCDRFWYETDDAALRFTERQLAEIRKVTLAKLLCQNMDHGTDMQRSAFDQPSSFLNPRLSCHSLPSIDLSAWRESSHGCQIGGRHVQVGGSGLPSPCTSCICTVEGAQCASLRVTDCTQLLREASREAILRDDICMAQCGGLVVGSSNTRGRSLPPLDLLPPPPRNRQRPSSSAFAPFKLHDLSFIG